MPGRAFVGNIDVGGLNRFGTQSSVDVRFLQQVFGLQGDLTTTRGRHLLKFGGLAERYLQDMVNPTFSLGTYSFANLRAFLENRRDQLHRPDAARAVRSLLAVLDCSAATLQDEFSVSRSPDAQRRRCATK